MSGSGSKGKRRYTEASPLKEAVQLISKRLGIKPESLKWSRGEAGSLAGRDENGVRVLAVGDVLITKGPIGGQARAAGLATTGS